MRRFVDANVLFAAALSPEGAASKLFAFAEAGACELVTSAFVGAEADPRLVERLAVPLPAVVRSPREALAPLVEASGA